MTSRKLDNFPEQIWTLFEAAAQGAEKRIPFAQTEHGAAVSVVYALRSFRRALVDGERTGWPSVNEDKRRRAKAIVEQVKELGVLGPTEHAAGWDVRVVPSWKKPIVQYIGRALDEVTLEPMSPKLEAEVEESQRRLRETMAKAGMVLDTPGPSTKKPSS